MLTIIQSDKWFPLCLFFLIFVLGSCFGWQTGYAINIARDFSPRLMSYAIGYGHEVWSAGGYYFWVRLLTISITSANSCRSRWWHPSLAVRLVASFMTYSYIQGLVPSIRRGWA